MNTQDLIMVVGTEPSDMLLSLLWTTGFFLLFVGCLLFVGYLTARQLQFTAVPQIANTSYPVDFVNATSTDSPEPITACIEEANCSANDLLSALLLLEEGDTIRAGEYLRRANDELQRATQLLGNVGSRVQIPLSETVDKKTDIYLPESIS